jgi:hypothetical protein
MGTRSVLIIFNFKSPEDSSIGLFVSCFPQVDDRLLQVFPGAARNLAELSFSTVQLSLELTDEHAEGAVVAPGLPPTPAQLQLTCLTTIPAFHGFEHDLDNHLRPSAVRYADKRMASLTG